MKRAIWKGSINFGLVNIPISLYTAESKNELEFHMLDRRDLAPVGYKRVNKATGKEVQYREIVKGYEIEEGQFVVLEKEDFRNANVKANQTIEIIDFVDADEISPVFYTKPYYLEPAKTGKKAYILLRDTLLKKNKVGIASVVIHTRQYIAAVFPEGAGLILELLRFDHELKSPEGYNLPAESHKDLSVSAREMHMAESLVEGMSSSWEPQKYKDTYRDDLLNLIKEKAESGKAKPMHAPEETPQKKVIDLAQLLKKSLEMRSQKRA